VQSGERRWFATVRSYESAEQQAAFEAATVAFMDARYLAVPLGSHGDLPSMLMRWWLALLALSQLARYEPATWGAAIHPQAETAVPLEETLRHVSRLMPPLVLDALTNGADSGRPRLF
jgi:hypothetical protein